MNHNEIRQKQYVHRSRVLLGPRYQEQINFLDMFPDQHMQAHYLAQQNRHAHNFRNAGKRYSVHMEDPIARNAKYITDLPRKRKFLSVLQRRADANVASRDPATIVFDESMRNLASIRTEMNGYEVHRRQPKRATNSCNPKSKIHPDNFRGDGPSASPQLISVF